MIINFVEITTNLLKQVFAIIMTIFAKVLFATGAGLV